jgi:hypothetical protein
VDSVLALRALGPLGGVAAAGISRPGWQGALVAGIGVGHRIEVDPSVAIVVDAVVAGGNGGDRIDLVEVEGEVGGIGVVAVERGSRRLATPEGGSRRHDACELPLQGSLVLDEDGAAGIASRDLGLVQRGKASVEEGGEGAGQRTGDREVDVGLVDDVGAPAHCFARPPQPPGGSAGQSERAAVAAEPDHDDPRRLHRGEGAGRGGADQEVGEPWVTDDLEEQQIGVGVGAVRHELHVRARDPLVDDALGGHVAGAHVLRRQDPAVSEVDPGEPPEPHDIAPARVVRRRRGVPRAVSRGDDDRPSRRGPRQ